MTQCRSTKIVMTQYSQFVLLMLLACFSLAAAAAPPPPPAGLCVQTQAGVTQCAVDEPSVTNGQAGVFPGTNLKFRPGFVISSTENESPSSIESRWQQIFTASPNRKLSYRPPGVYGGVTSRLRWNRFYTNSNVRPSNPLDHTDAGYNWSLLDAVFNINAVQNEGALVAIEIFESRGSPNWLKNAPFNGTFTDNDRAKFYRYTGKGVSPPIVEEYVYFHKALHDHLVATGNIDKVMSVTLYEMYTGNATDLPSDFSNTDLGNGLGLRAKWVAEVWAESGIVVHQPAPLGSRRSLIWGHIENEPVGLTFPDMKMSGTASINSSNRFTNMSGVTQEDIRPLAQFTENNGRRNNTYFHPSVPNPWGYSDESHPQTPAHVLWALSGHPKGVNKDSGLGQAGDDPPGIMPVHSITIDFNRSWHSPDYTVRQWHEAIDTFGPPGTFAFPYITPGYVHD
jgi:hypothetical protein